MERGAIAACLVFLLASFAFGYDATSFSFSLGSGGNANSSFNLDVVSNNSMYIGGCTDRLSAGSGAVLVNSGGNFIPLSNYDISSLFNASGIPGTARVELKITGLGTYNLSFSTLGCGNVSSGASTLVSIYGGNFSGYVWNGSAGAGLAGAEVRLAGDYGTEKAFTDSFGYYIFPNSPHASGYVVYANASGYSQNQTSSLVLLENESRGVNLTLYRTESALPSNGRVYGLVRNSTNNASVGNASIRIYKGGYSNSSQTGQDGAYSFSYLSSGNYTLSANATSFVSRTLLFEIRNSSSSVEFNVSMFTYVITNLANGASCEIGQQCASGNCCGSLCTALGCNVPNGGRCTLKSECELGLFCCNGFCQGVECIDLQVGKGGACNRTYQCQAGLACCSGVCNSGQCLEDVQVLLEKVEDIALGLQTVQVERTIVSNKSQNSARVYLSIRNTDEEGISNFEYRENIPGYAARDSGISFENAPQMNLTGAQDGVIGVWRYPYLAPGQEARISYTIGTFVDRVSGFSSFGQRYEEEKPVQEKIGRLVAPARIALGEQVSVTFKDMSGTPVENAGVVVYAPNSQNTVLATDEEGVAKYVATIEGDYSYSVQGWELAESVRKTSAISNYAEAGNVSEKTPQEGKFSLGELDKLSLGVAGLFISLVAAAVILFLLVVFYYIYLKK